MSKELEPEEARALDLLANEKQAAKRRHDAQAIVANYASEILRSKGEFVFTKEGMYGGTAGLIGSSNSGIQLRQATRPVLVGDSFVTLRDKESPDERERAIELVRLAVPKPQLIPEGTNVMTTIEHDKLTIPGVTDFNETHRLAVHRLIKVIDGAVEPLEEPLESMPRVIYHARRGAPRMINIRENPDTLAELGPGFRNLARRIAPNFSD